MDKKTEINKQSADRKPGKSRFLTTFVCIFLAIVVVFGGVVGVITAVRDARAVAKYSDVMLDEGEVIYLASRYKTMYLASLSSAGIAAGDSPVFWAKKAADGKTYGEHFNEGFREYIASVIVANYLYSSYTSYSTEDQRIVAGSIEEILTLKADGSVAKFNELTEKYGFDYMDFEVATEMLYRAETAKSVIYGNGGTGLASFPDECNEFLKKYSHVSLLFVRDATKIVKNENGILEEVALTDEERAERREMKEILRTAMKAREEEAEEGWITPEMFELFLKKSDSDSERYSKGYYFKAEASATAEFAGEYPEVVEAALDMQIGEYREVECNIGTCFIYRYEVQDGAYADTDDPFFSDFYSDAADYLFSETLSELSELVELREAFYNIDALAVPKNYEFYVKSWKK